MLPRRDCLRFLGLGMAARGLFGGASFTTTVADRVERYCAAPGPRPTGIKATRHGIWVVDGETAKAYLLHFGGAVNEEMEIKAPHPTAIEVDEVGLWIAVEGGKKLIRIELETGEKTREFDLPGGGPPKWRLPGGGAVEIGIHGFGWHNGELFAACPAMATIYVVKSRDGSILRSLAAPGLRPQGLAWDRDGHLWCAEADSRSFFKMDPANGKIVKQHMLPFSSPEVNGEVIVPHGMTIWQRMIYFCSPETGEIYRTPLISRTQ